MLISNHFSQSDLLLAIWALKFLLEPAVNAACMEDMATFQGLHLCTCPENLETDGAADLFFLPFDLFSFAFCKAFLYRGVCCC